MAYYKLTKLEFRAVAVFLNATDIPGLAMEIGGFEDTDYAFALSKLQKNGLMVSGERKNTWHIDETLILAMTAVVAPNHVVMVRDVPRKRSILFFILDNQITEVVVSDKYVGVAEHFGLSDIATQSLKFLEGCQLGQVAVASVQDNKLSYAKNIHIKGNYIALSSTVTTARSPQVVEEFIANSINQQKQ